MSLGDIAFWCLSLLPLPHDFNGFAARPFLLDREGGSGNWLRPFLQYVTAFQRCRQGGGRDFAIPSCTSGWVESGSGHICCTVRHFCFLQDVFEAEFQYLTAFWGLPRAILQYLTAFFAPSKNCNTLQHSGTGGREFAIPYCIPDTCKNERS